jgi:hypothetical protein
MRLLTSGESGEEAEMSQTLKTGTARASVRPASITSAVVSTTPSTNHAHAYANKFWATKNFAAYGASGTWSSIR